MEISGPGLDTARRHRPLQRVRVTEISPEGAAYFRALSRRMSTVCRRCCLAAPDSDIFLNVRSEGVARFKEYRLKGEDRVADQTAQVHLRKDQGTLAAVGPGQIQHFLNELAHLPGHGEDVGGELAAAGLVEIRAVQKLRVGHDDRQGRFQLVGGVRHELPLLLPRRLHRFYRPPGQQPADEQKGGEAQHPDGGAGLCQICQSGPLAGHICEGDALPTGRDAAAVPQAVFPEDTGRSVGVGGRIRQRFQELLDPSGR